MKAFSILGFIAFFFFPANYLFQADTPPATPNIIYILTDDLGYGDLGKFYQDNRLDLKKFDTPYIDQMADEGAMLMNHYVAAPVCAPSRSSLLQGLHQGHAHIRDDQFDKELPDDINIQNVLKTAGYTNYLVGKYGLAGLEGSALDGHPLRVGFDEFFGQLHHYEGHEHYPQGDANGYRLHENYTTITSGLDHVYTTDVFTAKAKQYITDHTAQSPDDPFFLYLSYDCPHAKMQAPTQAYPTGMGLNGGLQWTGAGAATPYVNTASGTDDSWIHPDYANQTGWTDIEKKFATMIRRIDNSVGDLMQLLTDLGIDQNTMIVFTSDNGPHFETGQDPRSFRSFALMDGIKRDLWEAGIRVPTIAWLPGVIPTGIISTAPSAHWDWLPTFADIAQTEKPAYTDGVSLMPELTGSGTLDREHLYFEYYYGGSQKTPNFIEFEAAHRGSVRRQMQAIFINDYKGIRYNVQSHDDDFLIYDIANDAKETTDIAAMNPTLQQQMKDKVLQLRRTNATAPRPYDNELIPDEPLQLINGLSYKYFEGDYDYIPDFEEMAHVDQGFTFGIYLGMQQRSNDFGVYFEGYFLAQIDGEYSFYTNSDAAVHMMVHDIHAINNDWDYKTGECSYTLNLKAGLHPIKLFYWHDDEATYQLDLMYEGPGVAKTVVPSSLLFSDEEFLPVELVDFSANKINAHVLVKWTTQTEINNDYFEVLRSKDGLSFESLTRISGTNSNQITNYNYTDKYPNSGVNYYRLKQVDFDGKTTYSDIVPVNFRPSGTQAFPNPVEDIFTIQSEKEGALFTLTDTKGATILQGQMTGFQYNLNIGHLSSGTYLLNVNQEIIKIIKH